MSTTGRITYDYLQYANSVGPDTNVELYDQFINSLIEAETYVGEAFSVFVELDPIQLLPEFMTDIGVNSTDIIAIIAPSTQLFDDLFFAWYQEMTDYGAIISTKYPYRDIRNRLESVDPVTIDCTPNSSEATTREESGDGVIDVTCGDLTNMGVAVERALERVDDDETESILGLSTVPQLLAHHSRNNIEQFLHEVTGRCRNREVGGLIHTVDCEDLTTNQNVGVEHVDYSVELRVQNQIVLGRVFGKRDTKTQWKKIGLVSDSARAERAPSQHLAQRATLANGLVDL